MSFVAQNPNTWLAHRSRRIHQGREELNNSVRKDSVTHGRSISIRHVMNSLQFFKKNKFCTVH